MSTDLVIADCGLRLPIVDLAPAVQSATGNLNRHAAIPKSAIANLKSAITYRL
jgi:hypothetical protein